MGKDLSLAAHGVGQGYNRASNSMDARRTGSLHPASTSMAPGRQSFPQRLEGFWLRVSEGMKLNDMWDQLRSDARTTYRLYSREIDVVRPAGAPR